MKPPVQFNSFPENQNLCVYRTLEIYLLKSETWRNGKTLLLLSYIKPHKPVATSTVSRWLLDMLKQAGIDTKNFKGHSTRAATSSKAREIGIPSKKILKRGQWSNESTFQKYDSKQINTIDSFQQAILADRG